MMTKQIQILIGASLILAICMACHNDDNHDVKKAQSILEKGLALKEENCDSALVILLNAVDGCEDADPLFKYDLFKAVSELYEAKNLSDQQQQYQRLMCQVAHEMNDRQKEADAHLRMSMTNLVVGKLDDALLDAREASLLSLPDSLEFKANCMLMQSQVFLQHEEMDSVAYFLNEAQRIFPPICQEELFRLANAYVLSQKGERNQLEKLVNDYKGDGSVFLGAELTRLLMSVHENAGDFHKAYSDACDLLQLTDSISQTEVSESMARIHELQHDRQMERNRAERASERTRLYIVIIVVLVLLLAITVVALVFRKRAIVARTHELEAMRLADSALSNEAIAKEENVKLQKLYYEHLYAIILPILNANRGKTGHINLEESSWKLIEDNTEMVIPGFTSKLRRNHPALSVEDVRFCCMIMMRVPNPILADVYGIAPSSVAIRKQRMKKKLDADIHEQTIENYLGQYLV